MHFPLPLGEPHCGCLARAPAARGMLESSGGGILGKPLQPVAVGEPQLIDEGRGMLYFILKDWFLSGEGRAKAVIARTAAARAEVMTVYIFVVLKRNFCLNEIGSLAG